MKMRSRVQQTRRGFAGGNDHHGPHVPEGYKMLGDGVLLVGWLWIMYRLKKDNGLLFGLYKPWLEEHHHEHIHYVATEMGMVSRPLSYFSFVVFHIILSIYSNISSSNAWGW